MKKEIEKLDATPSKRLFLSIIADYDLNKSICELVDNALDVWVRAGRAKGIAVTITLGREQQTITVEDDAGGIPKTELRYIVGPGQTGTNPSDETIGIFGVGTKRAVVALAQDIRIRTRHLGPTTYQVDFDDSWLASETWELPLYEVDSIPDGRTVVELQKLRVQLTDELTLKLKEHLSATYARFLDGANVSIVVDGEVLQPRFFENWAYPPRYKPRRYTGTLKTEDARTVRVEAVAGLAGESSPAAGEYGVYFYCNNRLVARALKTFEVGFTRGLAGLPHPKISLARLLVFLNGDARDMPWNSSKSGINTKHFVFLALHDWLVQVMKDYATLSRIWMGEWPQKVFKYETGSMVVVENVDFPTARKSFLPPMPKSRPRYADVLAQKNAKLAKSKPWTKGLYEAVVAADLLFNHHLEQKNRIALIVLDSTLEIAFKEYLVNESGHHYSDSQLVHLFSQRHQVIGEMKKYVGTRVSNTVWGKINYYYGLRCKLVHERVSAGVTDAQIEDFRDIVEKVLETLYKLKFKRD